LKTSKVKLNTMQEQCLPRFVRKQFTIMSCRAKTPFITEKGIGEAEQGKVQTEMYPDKDKNLLPDELRGRKYYTERKKN